MKQWFGMIGFVLCALVLAVTDVDLQLSDRFYLPSLGWYLADDAPWRWLYDYGQYPAIGLAVGAFSVLVGSGWRQGWRSHRRRCLVFVLAVVLGPGFVVNGVLKPVWGRPRPRQVTQFGGAKEYKAWYQPTGLSAAADKSFPSGHAAMGFVLAAGVVLLPRRGAGLRWAWLAGALSYGGLMGLARIVQGGHFLSDVLWAGGVVILVTWGLSVMLPGRS
ncbi:MAG: phosphatase PAP2 family protein [Candidatus Tectomicrobia bacterium]|nr:phosphatase PAP2 family protein [Candidatus Tectomicrobia bacterium]